MIFYFSGTGNSLYVAERISEVCGDRPTDVSELLNRGSMECVLRPGERLGFVFPVHCWGTPMMIDEFIMRIGIGAVDDYGERRHELRGIYVFAVMTYGSALGIAPMQIFQELRRRGLHLDYCAAVKMPDSYVLGADVGSEQRVERILREADEKVDSICTDIMYRKRGQNFNKLHIPLVPAYANKIFKKYSRQTSGFRADEKCSSCGVCERICPSRAISIGDSGRPVWTQERCAFCLGCINRCPEQAIQNGPRTSSRKRYHHPILDLDG